MLSSDFHTPAQGNSAVTQARLARHLGLGVLILYGVGDILGAGIYALVGKVAGSAGSAAWMSFLVSGLLALVTGLSYAEFSARVPHSAGASAFCAAAFRHSFWPFTAGMLVLMSGVTSAATVSLAFHGYLEVVMDLPQTAAALGLIVLLNLVSFIGIRQSAATNNLLTCIELAGLLAVIAVGGHYALTHRSAADLIAAVRPAADWDAIMAGATLAFFAFIGFEDLVNLAEEAREPVRDLPRAILIAIGVTTLLYLCVVTVMLWVLTPAQAAASNRPLLEVLAAAGIAVGAPVFSAVAMVAICNTGLANSIMASRLVYGMAKKGLLPSPLGRVHAGRRTPWTGILLTALLSAALVLTGGVTVMAQTTGSLLVCVFLLVHTGLLRLRRHSPALPGTFRAPGLTPYLGILLCVTLLARFPAEVWQRLGIVLAAILALYLLVPQRAAAADELP